MQYKWVQHKSKCVGGWWDHSSTAVSLFNSQCVWSLRSCQTFLFLSGQGKKNCWDLYRRNCITEVYHWNFMFLLYTIYSIQNGIKAGWLDGHCRLFFQRRNGSWPLNVSRTLALAAQDSPDRKEIKWLTQMLSITPSDPSNFCYRINAGGPG